MMKDKVITINSKTSEVFFDNGVLGIDNENLTGNLIFRFSDEFIDGTARLEIQIGDSKSYTMLSKEDESYTLPIKNFLTKTGKVYMELVITSGTDPENPIVWKSNIFYLIVNKAINAEIEEDENYTQWIDEAEARLNVLDASITQANNLDIDANKVGNTATITITKKDGTEESINIYDGQDGANGNDGRDGADAKINGVNTLTLEAGDNITLEQEGNTLTINSTGGGGGTSDYTDLTNKPKINNVELSGNKTTSDLGISYDDLTNKPDLSQYITKTVDDLINYYKKSETYTQAEINALIGAISTLNLLVVQTLPTEDISTTTIYLVPKTTSETNNIYDEYIYVSNAWEKIGSTEVDLSNYYTKTEADALLDDKQDTLTAGDNITIENNVISASGGGSTYFLTTPFTTATASTSLNADDIATLNKAIDDFRAGKDFVLIAKKMMFKTSGSTTSYSYNVNGIMRESGRYIYIDFYRNYGSASGTYPVNYDDTSLTRTMTLTNVSTPANITSASLPAQGTPSFSNNIITIGNTSSYNVTGDYNPTHKLYVDNAVSSRIAQYSTMPTASSSNVGSIVQFVGTTDSTYTNGYFYKCVEDNSVYSWENVEVQPASSGGDIPIYIWDGRPWSSSTPDTNADVKETWDKVIDCLLNGKPYSFYLIQTRKTGSSASTNRRMVFNITLSYTPTSNMLFGGAICFYSSVDYYCYDISIFNALDSNNKITSVPNKTVQVIYDINVAKVYNGSNVGVLTTTNSSPYNPTPNSYNPATTKYVDNKPTTYSGYDATKTQVLKNINGTLTWITEE